MDYDNDGGQDQPYDDEEVRDVQDEGQEHEEQMRIIEQELGDSPAARPVKSGEGGR